ncbi:gpW family head-tail joining protein [Chromobacterium violaceum]|uniref:gpW family head-tail joining protein n=1 Tax=Chromobacterium violaceum TaxID=536 RepID=UPI00194E3900|nr:gpW family head-tail joining protein [Chromobacterium violaceum]QRO34139.1 hypothetical protein I6K04_05175 [Chromobacterium violaceum]QRQ16058.1 hypothetical protein I6K03_17555 [Chromobacterium violaceum]
MTDIETLRQRLSDAEAARHRLLTGSMRERINRGGTDITYTRTSIRDLERYISQLQAEISRATGGVGRRIINLYL